MLRRPGAIYASIPGFRPLELDLYAPAEASAPRPAVVWIHGGAFALGSKRLLPAFLREVDFFAELVRRGFVVASIDYRLSGEARWPAQLIDVRAAVRWMRRRSAELGVDPAAIATWGESAGGHLSAMAGMTSGVRRPEEPADIEPTRVAAVIDWYGPTDFAAMDRQAPADALQIHDAPDSPESRLVGAPVQEAHAQVRDADPATHARAGVPPILIRHGRADRLVPVGQSEQLAAALECAGAGVDFQIVEGAGHVFEDHPDPATFFEEAVAFLRAALPHRANTGEDAPQRENER